MICHTMSAQVGALELVVQAVKSGELTQDSIQTSVARIEVLKERYLSKWSRDAPVDAETISTQQAALASEVYTKSTTLVRYQSHSFPIPVSLSSIVLLTPAKAHEGGGAVESSQKQPSAYYLDLLRSRNPNTVEVKFAEDDPLSPEEEKQVFEADAVILATKSANRSPAQKDFGLSLGKKLGGKLIVVATCDPYDFLREEVEIKNYITTYEPTIPAFKSAVDVIFGRAQAGGSLPVGNKNGTEGIRTHSGSDEDSKKIWELWQKIFPAWPIELKRMTKMLQNEFGKHLIHEKGFCIAFNFNGMGKISAVGVLPEARCEGLGTALITRIKDELKAFGMVDSLEIGSVFPRFWAGLPINTEQEYKDFFLHRGS
jgi:beta-N-acetylhexosaminidase